MGKITPLLEGLVDGLGTANVDPKKDSELLLRVLMKAVKDLDRARGALPKWMKVGSRGRVIIRKDMRLLLGWGEGTVLEPMLYPSADDPKGLLLRKAY